MYAELAYPYPITPILYKSRHWMKFNRVGKTLKTGDRGEGTESRLGEGLKKPEVGIRGPQAHPAASAG